MTGHTVNIKANGALEIPNIVHNLSLLVGLG